MEFDVPCIGRDECIDPLGPFDDGDSVVAEKLIKTKTGKFNGRFDPIEVEVVDEKRPFVNLQESKGGALGRVLNLEAFEKSLDKGCFSRAEIAFECDHFAWPDRLGELGAKA